MCRRIMCRHVSLSQSHTAKETIYILSILSDICEQRGFFCFVFFALAFLHQCPIHVSDVQKTLLNLSSLMFKEPIRVTANSLSGCMAEVTVEMSYVCE